jgi:hypothetical protein
VAYFSSVGEIEVHADRDTLFSVEQVSLASEMFLDPSFWQSLGKALGWDERIDDGSHYAKPGWLEAWHRFIDHLAEGKTAESFFETLE